MIDRATAIESTCIQLEVAAWSALQNKKLSFTGYSRVRIAANVSCLYSALLYEAVC